MLENRNNQILLTTNIDLRILIKFRYLLLLSIIIWGANLTAQNIEKNDMHHHDHKNEIGIANSPVYFIKEKEIAYGLHIHYIRNIGENHFGIGLGYERIFDEHEHNTIGIVGSFRPIDKLAVNVSPGITFEGAEDTNINFAIHLEASYEIEIDNIHIGPVLEFAYDPEDYHLSLGLHIGYGF